MGAQDKGARLEPDKNYVSILFWLFAFVIMLFPMVNILMTVYWAFSGDNESRKNFFKAMMLVWLLVLTFFAVIVIMVNRGGHPLPHAAQNF